MLKNQELQFENYNIKDVIGPPTWNLIHKLAYEARTKEEQLFFIKAMKIICQQFPCKVCYGHCKTYIKEHPMEKVLNVKLTNGEKLGLFMWTWKMHNSVNVRLGKPIVSWETALEIYSHDYIKRNNEDYCSECSGDGKSPVKVKEQKKKYKPGEEPYFIIEAKKHRHHDI